MDVQKSMSENWYFGVASAHTAVTGIVTVSSSSHRVHVEYQSRIHDRYNFDPGKAADPQGKPVADDQMYELMLANLAREFDMDGTSSLSSADFDLGDLNWGVGIGSPPSGR